MDSSMLPPLAAAPLLGNMTFIRQEPGRGQGEVRPGEVTAVSTEGSGGSQGGEGRNLMFYYFTVTPRHHHHTSHGALTTLSHYDTAT